MKKEITAQFYKIKAVKEIISAFEKENVEIRFIGGCVRNALIGKNAADIDFAVTSIPQKTIEILNKYSIKAIPTGLDHGTITAVCGGNQFEITTTRKDVGCDGRHALVEFSESFEEDAKRRDLTFNAMSLSPTGEIYDYFGGKQDLEEGIVKFVGKPEERVQEDYLRILRLYRFYSYYGKTIDPKSRDACEKFSSSISKLSGERICAEFKKILVSPKVVDCLKMMFEGGCLKAFLPIDKLDLVWLENLVKNCTENNIEPNPLRNLMTQIYRQKVDLRFWLKSTIDQKYIKSLENAELKESFCYENLAHEHYKYGEELFFEKNLLSLSSYSDNLFEVNLKKVQNSKMPIFPVSGKDLLLLGVAPGKQMGEYLNKAEELWKGSNFILSKDKLLQEIKNIM